MLAKQYDLQCQLYKNESSPGYWDQRYHIIIKMFFETCLKLTQFKSRIYIDFDNLISFEHKSLFAS